MSECMICEEVEGTRATCRVYRYGKDGNYSWQCTCMNQENWLRNHLNENLVSELVLYNGDNYCDHLMLLITVFEIKRQGDIENITMQLPEDKVTLVKEIYETNKGSMSHIEELFDKNTFKEIPFSDSNTYSYVELYESHITNNYTVKCDGNKWSCTCKGYKYKKLCKHINKIKKREEYKQNRREMGISMAMKYFQI